MENATPPPPEPQPSIPPVSVQANIPDQSSPQPPISPRIGVMLSCFGVLLLFLSLSLLWFPPGNCQVGCKGWEFILLLIISPVTNFLPSDMNEAGRFLVVLPFIASKLYVIVAVVAALLSTQQPPNNRRYWRVLFATGFCLVGLFLLGIYSYYGLNIGSWMAVGGFLVIFIGMIWQIRLARKT